MKANSSVFVAFAVGAVLASLPYTLSTRSTLAQGAGPTGQAQGGFGQGQPGFAGQGGFGQGQRFGLGQPGVTSMTTSGAFLFAASGDSIYKIKIDTMKIEGETKLPRPQFQPGIGNGGGGFGGGQGQGRRGGGGGQQTPPTEKK